MGLTQGGDGYKIYDPSTKCMSVTCDVHFLEGRAKPEVFCSSLLEKQEEPISNFEVDGSREVGSDELDASVLSTITLSPLSKCHTT